MGKHLTLEQQQLIIKLSNENYSIRKISSILNIPTSTIHETIGKHKNHQLNLSIPKKGKKPILSRRDITHLKHIVQKNPRLSASDLHRNLPEIIGKKAGRMTISRALN